jgi:hypothetical protein
VRVAAFVNEFLGVSAYMTREALNRFMQEGPAISGAYLGIGAVRSDWRARLENREEIEALALQLATTVQARPESLERPNQN